jgi:hypothetical protein
MYLANRISLVYIQTIYMVHGYSGSLTEGKREPNFSAIATTSYSLKIRLQYIQITKRSYAIYASSGACTTNAPPTSLVRGNNVVLCIRLNGTHGSERLTVTHHMPMSGSQSHITCPCPCPHTMTNLLTHPAAAHASLPHLIAQLPSLFRSSPMTDPPVGAPQRVSHDACADGSSWDQGG